MAKTKSSRQKPLTLAVDIGGSHVKIMLLDPHGKPVSDRLREPTPQPPTPVKLLSLLNKMIQQIGPFDRMSIGFPGVIKGGVVLTAANLHPKWVGFPLVIEAEKRWKRPTRLANDAAVQGLGAIRGKGVELVLTLGTGLGSALYTDGQLCPGLELGHHPWHHDHSYEDYLGEHGLQKHGKKKWNKLLLKAVEQTAHTFNWDHLYLGGGNAEKINQKLPENITIVSNEDGLTGGVELWKQNMADTKK